MGNLGRSLQRKQTQKSQRQNAPVAAVGARHAHILAHLVHSKIVQVKIRIDGELFVYVEEEDLDPGATQLKAKEAPTVHQLQKHISYQKLKTADIQVLADTVAHEKSDLETVLLCQATHIRRKDLLTGEFWAQRQCAP